jgi:hypothetical protein
LLTCHSVVVTQQNLSVHCLRVPRSHNLLTCQGYTPRNVSELPQSPMCQLRGLPNEAIEMSGSLRRHREYSCTVAGLGKRILAISWPLLGTTCSMRGLHPVWLTNFVETVLSYCAAMKQKGIRSHDIQTAKHCCRYSEYSISNSATLISTVSMLFGLDKIPSCAGVGALDKSLARSRKDHEIYHIMALNASRSLE